MTCSPNTDISPRSSCSPQYSCLSPLHLPSVAAKDLGQRGTKTVSCCTPLTSLETQPRPIEGRSNPGVIYALLNREIMPSSWTTASSLCTKGASCGAKMTWRNSVRTYQWLLTECIYVQSHVQFGTVGLQTRSKAVYSSTRIAVLCISEIVSCSLRKSARMPTLK